MTVWRIAKFKIMARGRVNIHYEAEDKPRIERHSLKRMAPTLQALVTLNPLNMPEGTEVTIDEAGKVTMVNGYATARTGRRPKGERPMTGAERQRAYMAKLRGI